MEESMERELEQLDCSLMFLILLVLSVLLSTVTLWVQRRIVCEGESGDTACLEAFVLRLRRAASALVVGSLGFFLVTAQSNAAQASEGNDPIACRSAQRNLWASLLVFCAALIRLYDLNAVERERWDAEAEDALPA